ncbi:MAG: helix-turn-helix domain-containing protein [Candidatus Accumulibacter sp.]|jgi:cytoskeleton protein RodZ|nr:helix-turn-helix domain-containing protein [Accumulibacter sp.]
MDTQEKMSEEKIVPDAGLDSGGEGAVEESAADAAVDVGRRLRLAREARGISIGAVSAALKLSPRQVEALEANDWHHWPRTITRGFVRNYGRYLELDAGSLMEALDGAPMPQGPELTVSAGAPANMPREGRGDRRDYARVAAGLIVLALAILAYFFVPAETWRPTVESLRALVPARPAQSMTAPPGGSGRSGGVSVAAPETAPAAAVTPVPEAASVAPGASPAASLSATPSATPPAPSVSVAPGVSPPAPVAPPATPPATSPAPEPLAQAAPEPAAPPADAEAPAPSGDTLVFFFAKQSWVEVRDRDGQVIFSRLNPGDSRREVSGRPPFSLVIGSASQVILHYRGKPVDLSQRSRDDVARLTLE